MEFIPGSLSILLGILAVLFARELTKRTDILIQSEDKRVKELIAKMDERTAKMDERTIEQSRILKEVQASAERIAETQKYVAELVRIEGEKMRSLMGH